MHEYSIEKSFGKYIIHKTGDNISKDGLYLKSIKKDGTYIWGLDYSTAKDMTLKTAEKHLSILRSIEK